MKTPSETAVEHFKQLQSQCDGVFKISLSTPCLDRITCSYQFADELAVWGRLIGSGNESFESRHEAKLLKVAIREYEYSLLVLAQGHYRHAFKSLRLVLELVLQSIYLSMNELKLREWLGNRLDTSWAAISDIKGEGIFSDRFANAFFPPFKGDSSHFGGMAALLYRECSECVHGNMPNYVPLPDGITFDPSIFNLWHGKAEILRLVSHYALTLRYYRDLTPAARAKLKAFLPTFRSDPDAELAKISSTS